jgi:hypothetical protein
MGPRLPFRHGLSCSGLDNLSSRCAVLPAALAGCNSHAWCRRGPQGARCRKERRGQVCHSDTASAVAADNLSSRCAVLPAALADGNSHAWCRSRLPGARCGAPLAAALRRHPATCHSKAQPLRGESLVPRDCNIRRHSAKPAQSLRSRFAWWHDPALRRALRVRVTAPYVWRPCVPARPSACAVRMVPVRRCARPPHGVLPVSATGRAPASLAAALRRQSGQVHATPPPGAKNLQYHLYRLARRRPRRRGFACLSPDCRRSAGASAVRPRGAQARAVDLTGSFPCGGRAQRLNETMRCAHTTRKGRSRQVDSKRDSGL